MRKVILVVAMMLMASAVVGQENEPEYIGEVGVLKTDGTFAKLDREIGDLTSGFSWSANSARAFWLEVAGGKAKSRFPLGSPLQLVVRAVDNNSDPLTIISIYRLKAKKKSRSVLLGEDNSGTIMKSRTNSKDLIRFTGKKYGVSSYLLTLTDLAAGEYGIVVANPNSRDSKRVVVSCFAIG